jgi:uncharacterized membrane protein HdeD (DUF308 family)
LQDNSMNATATKAANDGPAPDQAPHPARMLLLRGVLAILFGIAAVLWPDLTLISLVAMFAAYALLSGGASIVSAFRIRRSERKWWLPLLFGAVSVAAGVYTLVYPAMTALVLVLLMGVHAIITGALDIAFGIRLRKVPASQGLLVLSGIVSVLFGVLVLAAPGAGALALVWLISLYAVITGVLLLSLGLRLRRAAHGGTVHAAVPASGR